MSESFRTLRHDLLVESVIQILLTVIAVVPIAAVCIWVAANADVTWH